MVAAAVLMAADSPAEAVSTEAVLLAATTAVVPMGAITVVVPVTAEGMDSKAAAAPTVARAGAPIRWALPELGLLKVEASAILLRAGTDLDDLATPVACPLGQGVRDWALGPAMQV